MRTSIVEFDSNTGDRRAAEVLAGMKGLGVIDSWRYDDLDNHFYIRFVTGPAELRASARDVRFMGKGALVVLHHATDALSAGAADV